MEEDIKNIELRSQEVQEILGRPPRWLIRWGITVIFVVVAGLFVGSYFFKYPDILTATITVTTENLPAGVTAKISGRIDTLFVTEKQKVTKEQLLGVLENTANTADVLLLDSILNTDNAQKRESTARRGDFSCFSAFDLSCLRALILGDLQPAYAAFLKAYEDYNYFITADYHRKKIAVIEKQIATQHSIIRKSQTQLSLTAQQLAGARQLFTMDSSLFVKKMLSAADFENSRGSYLQNRQSYESAKLNIDNQQMSILQLEQAIFDLEQQRVEQNNSLKLAFSAAQDQLLAQIRQWEQTYLLVAPCNGTATFTKYWQQNQNVNANEVLVTIVPQEQTQIIGKILLPPQGAGKVKKGQTVNVKFDNFPYMEYGMVRVQITGISLVPIEVGQGQKAYMLEVVFPDKLVTNYGKTLDFTQEMQGTAEIVTEDLRLFDKFINPIKAVIKR
jgi:multidrug resistance efflux pump